MLIFIDTNIFFNHWHLRAPLFELLANYASNERATVLVSEVVCEEMNAKFLSERASAAKDLAKAIRRATNFQLEPKTIDAPALEEEYDFRAIPALVLNDGEVLIDSTAILDYLDEQAGDAALIPGTGPARRRVLQMTVLAQGTLEKVAAVVYERHFHSAERRSTDWLDRCLGQARAGLDELTRRLDKPCACGVTLTHADVMITTLIWYMQDRMDEVLSSSTHAALISLAERCEALPAFRAAALSDFEKMPRS